MAGGFGTRLSEETDIRPKPMVEIGGRPILWHIMKIYSHYGFNEFVICCGYKAYMIKQYFADYFLHQADMTVDLSNNSMEIHHSHAEPWKVTLADTGLNTMTGGRLKRIKEYLPADEPFLMTYGDGVSDINIGELLSAHKRQGKLATLTAVLPEGRFGVLDMEGEQIRSFREKSRNDVGWINGGYMVLEPEVLDYIEGDETSFEREPLEKLAAEGELMCYRHKGFWRCMDTLQDKQKLEELWNSGQAPWKTWE